MAAICVFCGSSSGADPVFVEAARSLGVAIAGHGHRLVYGGGHVGLMGVVADAVLSEGGAVTGRDDRTARCSRGGPPRVDRAGGHSDHARSQGPHGRAVRWRDRAPRRIRHARRGVRDDHLEPTGAGCRAGGLPRRRRLLRPRCSSSSRRRSRPSSSAPPMQRSPRRAWTVDDAVRLAVSPPEAFTPKWLG